MGRLLVSVRIMPLKDVTYKLDVLVMDRIFFHAAYRFLSLFSCSDTSKLTVEPSGKVADIYQTSPLLRLHV